MSDLYIEARLQAIIEIADSACSDSKDIENINGFCTEIEDFLNKQDVPDTNVGDLISRKKLIEDIQLIAKELNKDKQNAESDDSDLMLAVDNQLSAIWRIKGVINNQPQVQPIVRTPKEVVEMLNKISCPDCDRNSSHCHFSEKDCKNYWFDWLTKKEV